MVEEYLACSPGSDAS